VQGVLTSIVPGLVLGCLAAVALIIVVVWVRLLYSFFYSVVMDYELWMI